MDLITVNNYNVNLKDSKTFQKSNEVKIIFDLNPGINCEIIENIINTYFENIVITRTVQIMLGYLLSSDNSNGDVFCFYGRKHTGKSTLFKFISETLSPYFGSFDFSHIMEMITSKNKAKFENYFNGRRTNLLDNINNVEIILPFLKLKHNGVYKIPNNSKILAFAPTLSSKNIEEYGNMAFFIPLNYKFIKNPEKPYDKRIDENLVANLKHDKYREAFLKWVIEGAKIHYREGFSNFVNNNFKNNS